MSNLFHEQQAAARNKLIAEYHAQQAAANQPEPTPTPEPTESRPTYSDPAVEFAAQQAASAIRDSGGSPHDQREAAIAAAKQLLKEKTGLADAVQGLEHVDNSDNESLRDEVRALRAKLEERDAPLPDPSTVSDEFYFANREAYEKQLGIRNRYKL